MTGQHASVLFELRRGVLIVTLNNPRAGNVIDDDMADGLREGCRRAIETEECSVVLLTAAGTVFSHGAAPLSDPFTEMPRRRVAAAVGAIAKPVIAAIPGDAIGQGLELALACDLRLAADSANFAMDQVSHGQVPWDGGTQRLPRLLPRGLAMEMVLAGRSLTAQDALQAGLVLECVPSTDLPARALALAETLARMAPIAAAYAKEAILKGADLPLEHGSRLEADLAVLLQSTGDRSEGIRSFLEKRRPKFTGA